MPELYLATNATSGDECSSTYEGRHITLEESLLTHPSHADSLVDKGDPVIFGGANGFGVGVAFKSAAAATDFIAIDTEGIWFLDVVASDDDGTSAVDEGDVIYINLTTCVLSKIKNSNTQRVFGYALGDLTASATADVVAVKVHWDPYDITRLLAGTSSVPVTTAVADRKFWEFRGETTATSGDARGLYMAMDFNGAGVAGEAVRARAIASAAVAGGVHGLHGGVEVGASGSITGLAAGVRGTFMGPNQATAGGTVCGGMSELWAEGATTDYTDYTQATIHRFVNAGDATGKATAVNVFAFDGLSNTQFVAATNAVIDHALKIVVDGVDYWIGLYDATS